MGRLKQIGANLLHWSWVKDVLYWIITSAGMIAECAFLLASVWMSLNSSIHNFVRIFLSEQMTIHISELATAAYVGLPECILFLALIIVIGHLRTWLYSDKKDWIAFTWAILYGVPTLVFVILSLFTLGSSVLNVHFEMPGYFVVTRALSGYVFGVIAFLYWNLGNPQEVNRLQDKDLLITELQTSIELLAQQKDSLIAKEQEQITLLREELAKAKATWALEQKQLVALQKEINNAHESALEAYGEEVKNWLNGDAKTASIDVIVQQTGHPKRTITNAIRAGKLLVSSRNKELILMSSLIEWLKVTPLRNDEGPILHVVNE